MKSDIIPLSPSDFEKCRNIWDFESHGDLAQKCYRELLSGNRITYVYTDDGEFIGEISIVKDRGDPEDTIFGQRVYLSRLIVKDEYRRQGIGRKLLYHVFLKAKEQGYKEISVGVDLANYPALKLYSQAGFDKIIFIGEDEYGKYVKLLKQL
ncbi:MAG: GNAT family N-acetyltransferase [Ruminococcus sp.]|nr:GNAT family N-acetyltransferase [Ruminococcus sp.]